MRRALPVLALFALAVAAAATDPGWRVWDDAIDQGRVRVVRWTEPKVDALCRDIAEGNRRAVAGIDSLYRTGYFGALDTPQAQRAARVALMIRARTAFDYIADLAAADSCVRETDERELSAPYGEKYVNLGAFPYTPLKRARIGRGRFQMVYNLVAGFSATVEMLVDVPTTLLVEPGSKECGPRLRMDYQPGPEGTIEMLFDATYRGVVERRTVVDRGDTLDLVIFRDLEGVWVRKWGTHRLGGVASWRSRPGAPARVGAAAYFPNIHLNLPFFLPNPGLQDLRDFHVPRPIWTRAFVREQRAPAWLGLDPTGGMDDWEGVGERPRVLEEIFPNL
jgi:hypothetical protein